MKKTINPRKSTGYVKFAEETERKQYKYENNYMDDLDVVNIQNLEAMLRICEEIDFKIISGILSGESYSKIAERLYTSDSTVKYRIKRMLRASNIASVDELLRRYEKYLMP